MPRRSSPGRANGEPTADAVIRLIRRLSPRELAALMSRLPDLSAELCPDAAVVPRGVESELRDLIELHQLEYADDVQELLEQLSEAEMRTRALTRLYRKAARSKAGRRADPMRLLFLAHAQVSHERGYSWPTIWEVMKRHADETGGGLSYETVENLKTAVSRARKSPGFRNEVERMKGMLEEMGGATVAE